MRVVNNLKKIGMANTRVMSGKHLTALMMAASKATKLKDFSFWSIDDYTDKSIKALGPKKIFKMAAVKVMTTQEFVVLVVGGPTHFVVTSNSC